MVIEAVASLESESKKAKKSKKRKSHDSNREHEELAEVISEVHTANSWEKVDLGDDHRKLKFLKLMGASKVSDYSFGNKIYDEKFKSTWVDKPINETGELIFLFSNDMLTNI